MEDSSKPRLLGLTPSFGFGDRLGLATPGHLEALRAEGGPIEGIFAQQSIREMQRTERTAVEVMTEASEALQNAGFSGRCGADADHLKTKEDVDVTANAGFTFFTIDPSGAVDQHADDYPEDVLERKFAAIADQVPWTEKYLGTTLQVPGGSEIVFDSINVSRAAVKYGKAISEALSLAAYIKEKTEALGQAYELELSIDETEQPTTLAEHYIIADQFRAASLNLVSLAPRFIGDFEKGIDFIGDLAELSKSLEAHAAIARELGPYKLSLHSGSDKISMYAAFAAATRGMFHVKTAGTSYLEALRVVAHHEPALFRKIVEFSRERYEVDRATYHVSAELDSALAPSECADDKRLEQEYLECWEDVPEGSGFRKPGRQILHCTFGSVLCDPELSGAVRKTLEQQPDAYTAVLKEHFARHLRALRAGMQ